MKPASIFFIFPILLLAACSAGKKRPAQQLLQPNNLALQRYMIDPGKDNVIRTKNGAVIKLPKDALLLNGNGAVELQVKEAYSMKDILLAGLVTEADGQPLVSGGMIYINARQNDRDISLQKAARISIPASNYNPAMQLYKGALSSDSAVNWTSPGQLDTTPAWFLDAGQNIFQTNCASCHGIFQPDTGPALYDILNRAPSRKWLYAFTRNWETAHELTDSTGLNYGLYSCCKSNYSPTAMVKFPQLSDSALDAIYAYIQYESDKQPAPSGTYADTCLPCLQVPEARMTGPDTKGRYISPDNSLSLTASENNAPQDPAGLEANYRTSGFTDVPSTVNYEFTIETMGWYNVDAGYAGLPGSTYCQLAVDIENAPQDTVVHAYLVVPRRKNLSVANRIEGRTYSFDKVEGKIPLHLNDPAYLLAFGERNGTVVYGILPFTISLQNRLRLRLTASSKENFVSQVERLPLSGLQMQVSARKRLQAAGQSNVAADTTGLIIPTGKGNAALNTFTGADTAGFRCPCRYK